MFWVYLVLLLPLIIGIFSWISPNLKETERIHFWGSILFFFVGIRIIYQVYQKGPMISQNQYFYVDELSSWIMMMIVVIGFLSSIYSIGYIREEQERHSLNEKQYQRYYLFFHLFLMTMVLAVVSNNIGIMWVAIELTTLVSALLVAHDRSGTSLEAAWKYLIIGSVGISFALIGVIFLYGAAVNQLGGTASALHWTNLYEMANILNPNYLKYAFLFILIGFGTKAGLAPMHFWLPDAHSQAPTPISALLSGVLLNTAIFGVLRVYSILYQVYHPVQWWLILFGVFTVVISVPFLLIQKDIKRLLAYSSVEHIGIIFFGLGIATPFAWYGAILHMLNHTLIKSMLFFSAGHMVVRYRSKWMNRIRGVYHNLPISGVLFLIGIFAITGSPPFNAFISEYHILLGGIDSGLALWTIIVFFSIILIFAGMFYYGSKMILGKNQEENLNKQIRKENRWMVSPMLILGFLVILFGTYIPAPIDQFIQRTIRILQGGGLS
ncbi:hydrogenase 4 subunit F [Tepidibacillus infernus]|uniref:hydrogenase 4 subunit F n=1 Tax=Tepidibacillus infernus TaxID=1806172 RepID=UPI003B71DD17